MRRKRWMCWIFRVRIQKSDIETQIKALKCICNSKVVTVGADIRRVIGF